MSAMRQIWFKANYLLAIGVGTLGWLWFIVWIGLQLI
jgi:hypothetical protein